MRYIYSYHVLQKTSRSNKTYETLFDFIEKSNFSLTRNFVHWYITFFNPKSQEIKKLSKKQRILYGLDEDVSESFLDGLQ